MFELLIEKVIPLLVPMLEVAIVMLLGLGLAMLRKAPALLRTTLKEFKKQGVFVLGLDGGGDVMLPALELADRPVVIVVGSEGKGLSRLVTETCDQVVSIPISAATESLNAGIAASVALYQVSTLRAASE